MQLFYQHDIFTYIAIKHKFSEKLFPLKKKPIHLYIYLHLYLLIAHCFDSMYSSITTIISTPLDIYLYY